ncbi:MAG: bifunctional diaminohydroxyphosphoribosylaminopyrimidine deaminase/5-amino-6-(5-phosphoribosylamino)uracil reductase RibD [Cyclobacteriaceae bacterium]
MIDHNFYMQRAFDLARSGKGSVSPNPMVGCVIVHEGKIIGEGYHREYGGPHAEVNAIASVSNKALLSASDVYVSLEPCSHYGKTPPCADLLIRHKVKRVILANPDPNPLVSGNGVKKLQEAGIEVLSGTGTEAGERLNKRFFTFMRKHRPYIILKWAETADGFVARENYDSKWISNSYSRQLVHKWRAEEDAIMVGTNTARYDDPKLNVRNWYGKNPLRIVVDNKLSLSDELQLFSDGQPTICYNLKRNKRQRATEYVQLPAENYLTLLTKDLYNRKIQSLIVEGGTALLHSFIEENLWDEARIFRSKTTFGSGIASPAKALFIQHKTQPQNTMDVHGDTLITILNK